MEDLDTIRACAANGLSSKETEAVLGRPLSDNDTREYNRTKAFLKLKNKKESDKSDETLPKKFVLGGVKPRMTA